MATYDDFKESGVKGVSSLDAGFILKTDIDFTEQDFEKDDLIDLCDVPASTVVVGIKFYGTGQGSVNYVEQNEVTTEADTSVAQITTIVFADEPIAEGNKYKVSVGSNDYEVTASTTLTWTQVLGDLETAIEAGENIGVVVTAADRKLVLTAEANNTAFTTEVVVTLIAHNVQVGTSTDADAVTGNTDLSGATVNSFAATTIYFQDETTIKMKNVTTDVPLTNGAIEVAMLCVTV